MTEPQKPSAYVDGQPAQVTYSDHAVTVLCHECGDLIEVKDPAPIILTLHQRHECPAVSGLFGQGNGE